jgi:hypothetical protein
VGQLLETGKDTAIVLDLANEALNQMTFLVQMGIVVSLFNTILAGWDDWNSPAIDNQLQKVVGIIGTVCNDVFAFKPVV